MAPPLWHHMSYWKTILTIWHNMKARDKKLNFSELGKIWKCNLGFSKVPISHLFYVLIWASLVKMRWGNHVKKDVHILNLNDWDIPFPKILRIYQWIGKKHFPLGKKEWTHCEFCPYQKYFGKRTLKIFIFSQCI